MYYISRYDKDSRVCRIKNTKHSEAEEDMVLPRVRNCTKMMIPVFGYTDAGIMECEVSEGKLLKVDGICRELTLPKNDVDRVASGCFKNCKVSKLVIPPNIATIESYAFNGCDIGEIEVLGDITFEEHCFGNSYVRNLTLHKGLKVNGVTDVQFVLNNLNLYNNITAGQGFYTQDFYMCCKSRGIVHKNKV